MTEQQLNMLKELLASSKEVENSTELDAVILAASLANTSAAKKVKSRWHPLFPINSLATTSLSIIICIGVLIAMSQIISIDDNAGSNLPVPNGSSDLTIFVEPVGSPRSDTIEELTAIIKPSLPAEFGGRTTQDQVLAGLELPSAQALLEGKEFTFADQRSLAESSLSGALADINEMLRSGALNEARVRYDRLRRSCAVCDLPSSLEALALAKYNSTTRI